MASPVLRDSVTSKLEVVDSDENVFEVTQEELQSLLDRAIVISEITCSQSATRQASQYNSNSYFMSTKLSVGPAYNVLATLASDVDINNFGKDPQAFLSTHGSYTSELAKAISCKVQKCFDTLRKHVGQRMQKDGIQIFNWGETDQ